jgi:hypothetical protein
MTLAFSVAPLIIIHFPRGNRAPLAERDLEWSERAEVLARALQVAAPDAAPTVMHECASAPLPPKSAGVALFCTCWHLAICAELPCAQAGM